MQYSLVSTGFSSGIGAYSKEYMDQHYPEWYHIMICRDPSKVTPNKNLKVLKADLLSIASVVNVCKEIIDLVKQNEVPPIKYILANAGALYNGRTTKSVDGYEAAFHVNVISNYYLLKNLIPIMVKEDPRVFVTGSNAHYGDIEHNRGFVPAPYWNDENLDPVMLPIANDADKDPTTADAGTRAYSTSKLAVIYLIRHFSRQYPRIKFMVFEPGFVPTGTGLNRDRTWFVRQLFRLLGVYFRTTGFALSPQSAGVKLIETAFNEDLFKNVNNYVYCDKGEFTKSSPASYKQEREVQLWNSLESISG